MSGAPAGRSRSACLLGGVSGNVTDRIVRDPAAFHGHVVDFLIAAALPDLQRRRLRINVAAGLIILQTFRGVGLDGSRDADHRAAGSTATQS